MSTQIGDLVLRNPVMAASGTAGYADELSGYMDLAELGAVVTKSLSPFAWNGNPPPRLVPTAGGMINSVGLQNPGVSAWRENYLPKLTRTGATVIASIWGRTVDDYRVAAAELVGAEIAAVEVNISCPNLEAANEMFAHSSAATAAAVGAAVRELAGHMPVWAKLSPNASHMEGIAISAVNAGAQALTLTNTLTALAIEPEDGKPVLGNVGGGLSGPALRPVAQRAVYDVRNALGDIPLIGVGGIMRAEHAVEFMAAGASAVQVGTATFADPRAPLRIAKDLSDWCVEHGVAAVSQLVGTAHK